MTISRVRQSVTYPSSFTLISATNPCPCGYYGSHERYCTCTAHQVKAYQLRASGPLLDRIDFLLPLKSVGLKVDLVGESSEAIRKRTTRARERQVVRYNGTGLNGSVPFQQIIKKCNLPEEQANQLQEICFEEKWSNRTHAKLMRIAQTIADLNNEDSLTSAAIDEAVEWKKMASELQLMTNPIKN